MKNSDWRTRRGSRRVRSRLHPLVSAKARRDPALSSTSSAVTTGRAPAGTEEIGANGRTSACADNGRHVHRRARGRTNVQCGLGHRVAVEQRGFCSTGGWVSRKIPLDVGRCRPRYYSLRNSSDCHTGASSITKLGKHRKSGCTPISLLDLQAEAAKTPTQLVRRGR